MGGKDTVGRERVQVRMPEDLKKRLSWSADRTGRTLNAEILSRLIESFGAEINLPVPPRKVASSQIEDRVASLEEVVARLSELVRRPD